MNTCCNSLVEKMGYMLRSGGLMHEVMEDEIVVIPCRKLYQRSILSAVLYVINLMILITMEFTRGLNTGVITNSGSASPIGSSGGIMSNKTNVLLSWIHRFFSATNSYAEQRFKELGGDTQLFERKCIMKLLSRVYDISVVIRETIVLWYSVIANVLCDRLPSINFDEDKLTRLGEWFTQTIGFQSYVFSKLSKIYSGRVHHPK